MNSELILWIHKQLMKGDREVSALKYGPVTRYISHRIGDRDQVLAEYKEATK